jgi:hypothetical protein
MRAGQGRAHQHTSTPKGRAPGKPARAGRQGSPPGHGAELARYIRAGQGNPCQGARYDGMRANKKPAIAGGLSV